MLRKKEVFLKKDKMKKYLKTGMGLVGASVITGAIPNLTGTATETGLKANLATGLSNTGKALPLMGSVKGTQMVMKSMSLLQKKGLNKIKFKGAYKL